MKRKTSFNITETSVFDNGFTSDFMTVELQKILVANLFFFMRRNLYSVKHLVKITEGLSAGKPYKQSNVIISKTI